MQLRTLTLQAVGPFAGRHTVDFAALAASGLFLLEGPTGSGKSTIIDAVVFALYGKVASADASEDRLRSAYAADDVATVVDLTFEVASGVYRVRRTPGYDRPKKRGTGTVKQQPSITLWRLSGEDATGDTTPDDPDRLPVGEVLSTRLDEAGAEIQRVVGLDRTQFVQTIVLPQGEFARFLRANPEDRRVLLQKIFGTEVYDRIGRRLAEMRRDSAAAVETARTALGASAAHLVGAARLGADDAESLRADLDAVTVDAVTVDAVRDVVGALTGSVRATADAAREAADAAEAVRSAARLELDDVTRTSELLRRRDALRAERAALDEAEPVHREAQARVTAAVAAQVVRPLLRRADEAVVTLESATKSLDAAVDAAPADLADLARPAGSAGPDPDAVGPVGRAALDAAREEAVGLTAAVERLVTVEAGLEARRQEVRTARAVVDDVLAEIATHETWLAERPAERTVLVTGLETARALAGTAGERRAAVDALEVTATALVALDAARTEHTEAETRRTAAGRSAATAVAHEAALRTARIAGLAGELAAALGDGDACPVCGAVEHPAKAGIGVDHVAADAVQDAEDARVAAERALRDADTTVARCTERVEALSRQVGDATAQDVATRLAAARSARDAALAAAADVDRLVRAIDAHDAATRQRTDQREAARTALAAAEVRAEALVQQLAAAEAEVEGARDGFPTVAARHAALRARVLAAGALVDALLTVEQARLAATTRTTELTDGLATHGFGSAADARAALVEPAVLAELTATVEAYTAAVAGVRAGLADAAVVALPDDLHVDLHATQDAERRARAAADEAAGAARVALERATAVDAAATGVLTAAQVLAERVAEHAPVARLAGIAGGTGGDNAQALSLATFVLTRRFEDVVAAANDRLLGMSDGRYELVRSDRKEDVSSRRTGLSMRVVDHRTGHERDPRTLSGGETFYVSLCLALGMADVVTAEAGGIDLGTLFVDEGFGSLDPHTLEQVLAELGRLRAGGRVVGVVSHVETLKQSIADRIEVRPTADGPSTLTVRAG